MKSAQLEHLEKGQIEIVGRLVAASNASLFCKIEYQGKSVNAIYKPIKGERPLWDFPDGNLASREVATYLASEALGLGSVPPTILRDGPFGEGSVQLWIDEVDEFDDRYAQPLPELRKIALLDAVVNNTDRKIGHLLFKGDRVYGCDHGVTFHEDYKLRTVLWQFADEEFTEQEMKALENFKIDLDDLVTTSEKDALNQRIEDLLSERRFPLPPTDWPAVPWPPV